MNISKYVKDGYLKVKVKPGKRENMIEGWDEAREAIVVSIAAPAQKNKANKELVKYMAEITGMRVTLKSGETSRTKLLEIRKASS